MDRRERALAIAVELVKARELVARLEEEFSALVPGDPPSASGQLGLAGSSRKKRAPLPYRILELLRSESGRAFTADEIRSALAEENINTLRTALARLCRANRIERPRPGVYLIEKMEVASS